MDKSASQTQKEERISVIELNEMLFGIGILKAREVVPLPVITPVPNTQDFVVGVFNLRGDIYTIVDLGILLGMKPKQIRESDMVMILDNGDVVVGVLVDRIHGVRSLDGVKVESAKGLVAKSMQPYILGVISDKTSQIFLLDIDRLFESSAFRMYS